MIIILIGIKINNNIQCIGFSKDIAYIFNPETLFSKILQFIKIENSKRKTPLLCRKILKNPKRVDLLSALQKLA